LFFGLSEVNKLGPTLQTLHSEALDREDIKKLFIRSGFSTKTQIDYWKSRFQAIYPLVVKYLTAEPSVVVVLANQTFVPEGSPKTFGFDIPPWTSLWVVSPSQIGNNANVHPLLGMDLDKYNEGFYSQPGALPYDSDMDAIAKIRPLYRFQGQIGGRRPPQPNLAPVMAPGPAVAAAQGVAPSTWNKGIAPAAPNYPGYFPTSKTMPKWR
jgi:hypothetical protein